MQTTNCRNCCQDSDVVVGIIQYTLYSRSQLPSFDKTTPTAIIALLCWLHVMIDGRGHGNQSRKSWLQRTQGPLRKVSHDQSPRSTLQGTWRILTAADLKEAILFLSRRALVIQECQLIHPIAYDSYNICDMCATNKLSKLGISLLRLICIHFDMDIDTYSSDRA